jgi:hypothetical protein
MDKPNLIERMENLIAVLDEIETHLLDDEATDAQKLGRIGDSSGDAYGIAGEILTMIDGR